MKHAAGIALLVLAFAPSASHAGDDPPTTPPISLAAWEERDAEGKWVLYKASEGAKPGDHEDRWIPFLAKRKKYQLLEWIAVTTAAPAAVDALAEADAPAWPRCALWAMSMTDSHMLGSSQKWLTEKKPGAALAWAERFPAAAAGIGESLLKQMRSKHPMREDGSSFLPPFTAEDVFGDLSPPKDLDEWGERTHAEPGHRYVHQVERAIDAFTSARTRGEPWERKLAALLAHPHPKVRRAAALAYGRFYSEKVPMEALLQRAHDEKEALDVRSAALLGASHSPHPAVYADLIEVARNVKSPLWRAAASRLGDIDDGFALELWPSLATAEASADAKTFWAEQAVPIRERVAAMWKDIRQGDIPRLLERAAWVDLGCNPLEGTLVPWTLKTIRDHLSDPKVRGEVLSMREGYKPNFSGAEDELESVSDRVRSYAKDLLPEAEKR